MLQPLQALLLALHATQATIWLQALAQHAHLLVQLALVLLLIAHLALELHLTYGAQLTSTALLVHPLQTVSLI